MDKVNLGEKLAQLSEQWKPKIVGELNGQMVKLVKFQGPFVWHHPALLKQRCGTGGTGKDRRIEIQGDQRERIVAELEKLDYKVKRVGG